MPDQTIREALTFDDVLLVPGASEILPGPGRYPHPPDQDASNWAFP